MLTKLQNWLLGRPKTADYRRFPDRSFTHVRDLPLFTFETIRAMLIDPTVRLGLAMRAAPLFQAEFAYKASGGEWTPGVQADRPDVAVFVYKQLQRIWKHELHKILTAQVWGWSAGEVTYRLVNKQVEVDCILHRFAGDVYALLKDGQVEGVRFDRLGQGTGREDLRFPRSLWHAYDAEAELPYGTSALKGAHSPWADKWLNGGALDVRRLFAHKDAYGGVDLTYPPGTSYIKDEEIPNRDIAREIVEQIKAGGVTTRPSEYDATGKPLWELKRATIPSSPTHIFDYPKDLDVEILRGMEIPDDVLTSEGTGAWQGKQVPMLAFYTNADRWLAQVVRAVVTQILEPLVLINWGQAEEFEVTTKPLAEQAMEQIKATQNDSRGPQQQAAQQNGSRPLVTVHRADGTTFQHRNPAFGRERMSLDDGNVAELLVGQGVVDASRLVEAGRHFLNNGGSNRMAQAPEVLEGHIDKGQQRFAISSVSRLMSLTADEAELLEHLADGR